MLYKVSTVYIQLISKVVISLKTRPPNSPSDCERVVQYSSILDISIPHDYANV